MNADAVREFWWPTFGLLALESTLVIGVGALCGRLVQSAVWRRTIWQGCIVTLLALVAVEFSGGARAWISRPSPASPATIPPVLVAYPTELPAVTEGTAPEGAGKRAHPNLASPHREPFGGQAVPFLAPREAARPEDFRRSLTNVQRSTLNAQRSNVAGLDDSAGPSTAAGRDLRPAATGRAGSQLFAWSVILWFTGTMLLLAKSLFSRAMLVLLRLRSTPVQGAEHRERLGALCARMKLRRHVSLFESERLSSPAACGVFRPAIGLPLQFTRTEDATRQEVMLAHELAHLEAGDPAWSWVAEAVVALLWWQPLVWWMRRRLHAASECAADEASLLVANGPGVLAECLVELGQRLTTPRPTGWLGVEGRDFRSGLGRRVERLLNLGARSWQPPKLVGSALARTAAPAALIALVVLATAWTIPVTSTEGDSMKNPLWNKSMTALALASAFGAQTTAAAAAETNALPRPAAASQDFGAGGGGRGGGGGGNNRGGQGGGGGGLAQQPHQPNPAALGTGAGAEGRTSSRLKAKLEAIVLDEVSYDCLPLNQVTENLIKEAVRLDPDKTGVNFLMGKATESFPLPIDPATGLPITAGAPEPVDLASVTICIRPPLKKVRLIDVLDAITRVADRPVKYSLEEYAVVWTPVNERPVAPLPVAPAPAVAPQVRAFKLDTNLFLKSLEKAFGVGSENNSTAIRDHLLNSVFPRVGLHLNEASTVIYNEVTGVLLVRTTPENLAIIQATVETLGGKSAAPETASTPAKR